MLKHMLSPPPPPPPGAMNGGLALARPGAFSPSHQRHALNVSTLSTSKHSLGNSSGVSPGGGGSGGSAVLPSSGPVVQMVTPPPKMANGGLHIPRGRAASLSAGSALIPAHVSRFMTRSKEAGIKEMLTSLGLLCLVSLLLALLSLIFLLRISPMAAADVRDLLRAEQLTVISAEEYVVVYEVTLALCALTLSLNLCCLLVCAIQFLFAVKLVKSLQGGERTSKYLQKSSITRVCAVGGFFISIPVFLTGIILYTFIQFHSTPAIVTSVLIGLGIIFCGCAMVHNVFIWQREKTNAVRALAKQQQQQQQQQMQQQQMQQQQMQQMHRHPTPPTPTDPAKQAPCHLRDASGSVSPGVPGAMLDLSSVTTTSPHELSTLV
ncbi:uncharacterized protein LOC134531592 [Bacillus rossius redtenbacheri]|uniref:uncharacterized protein LOC134531592 n=1 Tax=Bacillus rossius redtenbacheri TaxID=93214 RepID=UPI002FDDF8E8